jgi:hypothetical protein
MSSQHRPDEYSGSKEDTQQLHSMGYAQELSRRMSGFSNFAISFSIICILAGGITSFQLGFSAAGGAAIGIGWPLSCAFSLIVAASMGQIASAYPTAGGLYHWASILGGRGFGWSTAWFNMLGLIFVVSSGCRVVADPVRSAHRQISGLGPVPSFRYDQPSSTRSDGLPIGCRRWPSQSSGLPGAVQPYGHPGHDDPDGFSAIDLHLVAIILTVGMRLCARHRHQRLFTFTNNTGDAGGGVWPQTNSV